MAKRFAILVLFPILVAALPLWAAQEISDESLKLEILDAIFPQAAISMDSSQPTDDPVAAPARYPELAFPDALQSEQAYRVTAPLLDRTERCAASDEVSGGAVSTTRVLRFQAYGWPGASNPGTDILAVAQYDFAGADPPEICHSIARLVHLRRDGGEWRKLDHFVLDTTYHTGLQRIQLVDLGGDGTDELIVESDDGGTYVHASHLIVFSLKNGRFEQWLNVPSRVNGIVNQAYSQILDIPETQKKKAQMFCFVKKVFAEGDSWLAKPRETKPCYKRFTGDPANVAFFDP